MSVKQLFDLSGRVAVITGGSRGLGLQIAEALGEMGAKVAITARTLTELDEAASHLSAMDIEVMTICGDLFDLESIPAMVDVVLRKWGKVDILVNNAGASWAAPTEEHSLAAWQKVIGLNLTSTFVISQDVGKRAFIPQKKGRIVNIASIAGLIGTSPGMPNAIAYSASKGGVVNFTRALAAEWGPFGITVNAICPGFFRSKMSQGLLERVEKQVIDATPLRRICGEEDIKGLVALLASDASQHITGQVIAVDGGQIII
ncbi:MAG: SDR family oxidoreductase [Burkholderiaceae bacterium]